MWGPFEYGDVIVTSGSTIFSICSVFASSSLYLFLLSSLSAPLNNWTITHMKKWKIIAKSYNVFISIIYKFTYVVYVSVTVFEFISNISFTQNNTLNLQQQKTQEPI